MEGVCICKKIIAPILRFNFENELDGEADISIETVDSVIDMSPK